MYNILNIKYNLILKLKKNVKYYEFYYYISYFKYYTLNPYFYYLI